MFRRPHERAKVKGVAELMATTMTNENTQTEGVDVDSAEARGRLAADMIAQRLPTALEPTVVEESRCGRRRGARSPWWSVIR